MLEERGAAQEGGSVNRADALEKGIAARRSVAIRSAKRLCAGSGMSFADGLADSLAGDVIRFGVLRELRRTFPEDPVATHDALLWEYLTP